MAKRIPISELKPGMVIEQITRQNGPVKIRKAGLVSSAAMVQGLAEMGVQEVEIDPEQTVEIAVEVRPKTQTQALLRGHHDTSASFDHSLSDQFNRSLFLPTVQGLPSVWKVYAKQYLVVAILLAGGFGIGFTAATPQNWWPGLVSAFTPSPSAPVQVVRVPAPEPVTPAQSGQPAKQTSTEGTSPAKEEGSQMQAQASPPSQPQPETEEFPEGRVLNEKPDENQDVKVSADLMARFNKAVSDLQQEDEDPEPVKNTKVTVHDDIPRVDQLPARLLTRLPSMSFSAHMYASRPADRWVRVNGEQLGEGDWINDNVKIISIEAQRVILSFEGERFSMAALTDW